MKLKKIYNCNVNITKTILLLLVVGIFATDRNFMNIYYKIFVFVFIIKKNVIFRSIAENNNNN